MLLTHLHANPWGHPLYTTEGNRLIGRSYLCEVPTGVRVEILTRVDFLVHSLHHFFGSVFTNLHNS